MTKIILYQNDYCNITKYLSIFAIRKNLVSFSVLYTHTQENPVQGKQGQKYLVLNFGDGMGVYSLILQTSALGRFVIFLLTYFKLQSSKAALLLN